MNDLLARTSSVLSGLYTIESEIGRGGMATVFLATDRKHSRKVAVKVMHPELAAAIGGERFLREINIEAHLQHPHIVPLLDSGEVEGLLYYVMPFVEGESLRRRLSRGPLDVADAVRYWRDVVDAIAHAHRQRVVHRDIKPENVLIAERHASVVDFGVGKAIGTADTNEALTKIGVVVGTPLYMAPEQAIADETVDHRADIYSLGILGYEMLTGKAPFAHLAPAAQFASKASEKAPDVRELRRDTPDEVAVIVARCLQPEPGNRFQSADELLSALESLSTPGSGTSAGLPGFSRRRPRRTRAIAIAAGTLTVIVGTSVVYAGNGEKRWAEQEGVPALRRLAQEGPTVPRDSGFLIARRVRAALPASPETDSLIARLTRRTLSVKSRVPGMRVSWAAYRGDTTTWHELGSTPLDSVPVPDGGNYYLLVKYEQPGYRTAIRALDGERGRAFADLDSIASPDSAFVRVRGANISIGTGPRSEWTRVAMADFRIGRHEVTNREYKAFVAAGGYQKKELWDLPIRDGAGNALSWEAASARFRDRTGRVGPASWEAGDIPAGKEDFPVAGISWYEARAYARFAGGELPTIHHWRIAALVNSAATPWMLPVSNVKGSAMARVGEFKGMTPFGAFDMAGNVREWCVNTNGTQRYILGGSWQEDAYVFASAHSADPLDRTETNGMRLMGQPSDSTPALAALAGPAPRGFRDYSRERPVGDAQFRSFLPLFDYDRTPLNADVIATDSSDTRWVRETVEYDAAYGNEKIKALVYLPRGGKPPYQAVVFYPGGNALADRTMESMRNHVVYFDFLVTTGRVVIFPMYKDTYERQSESVDYATDPIYNMSGGLLGPNTYRDHTVMQVKDLRRTLDYLATRGDVDTARLGYSGYSWGGRLASINLAVEKRFKAAALGLPGLMYAPRRPEVDEINFLPHVKTPVLIMSGRYDNTFVLETAALPYVRFLGVPPAQLRHVIYPTLHNLPRDEQIRETLDWFDKYLGKVTP